MDRKILVFIQILSIIIACNLSNAQERISDGTHVPNGELEAIGTIPGCTATLIADDMVLTAAHCVCDSSNPKNCVDRTTFTLHDVFPKDDPTTNNDESQERQDVSISGKVRHHPEYELRGWAREDLAVIDLDQPATDVAYVKPISIEDPYENPIAGEVLTIVGFGDTKAGCEGPSLGKRKASLPVKTSDWGRIRFEDKIIYSCPGDSGGPAINSNGHLVGVASWGDIVSSTYRPTSYSYNWIFSKEVPFNFQGWGNYLTNEFLGNTYFAGYSNGHLYAISGDKILEGGKGSKILIDEDNTILFAYNLALKEGYEVAIKSIDEDGEKAYVELSKNGQIIDSKVLSLKDNATIEETTYCYKKAGISKTGDFLIIAVHYGLGSYIMPRTNREIVFPIIDGTWQISENLEDTSFHLLTMLPFDPDNIIFGPKWFPENVTVGGEMKT